MCTSCSTHSQETKIQNDAGLCTSVACATRLGGYDTNVSAVHALKRYGFTSLAQKECKKSAKRAQIECKTHRLLRGVRRSGQVVKCAVNQNERGKSSVGTVE